MNSHEKYNLYHVIKPKFITSNAWTIFSHIVKYLRQYFKYPQALIYDIRMYTICHHILHITNTYIHSTYN